MRFTTSSLTRKGGRKNNQDAYQTIELPALGGCWVVADGLGGHGGGEIAAQIAVEAVTQSFKTCKSVSTESLQTCIEAAHQGILIRQAASEDLKRMRTTLVLLQIDAQGAQWAHIGDSRLYWFRNGAIAHVTRDHSVPQALADAGSIPQSEIRYHEDRNRILRSLGNVNDLRPTYFESKTSISVGDAFLLCTDGFWEYVHEFEMQADLAKSATPDLWLRLMEERLLSRATSENDNYTAVTLMID